MTKYTNQYLRTYPELDGAQSCLDPNYCSSFEEAVEECDRLDSCCGITLDRQREGDYRYTVHKTCYVEKSSWDTQDVFLKLDCGSKTYHFFFVIYIIL